MAEKRRADVPLQEAVQSYVDRVLPGHRDESVYLPASDEVE